MTNPLLALALSPLPLGSIRARGWLLEQLRLAADGLTGRMMEIWPDVGLESGWLGGSGENWERGPYYARGLTALAYTLGDAALTAQARPWIEWSLASQRPDGFFGPPDNDDWWPRMPMLDALRLYHDATADPRVIPFLARYFRHQLAALPARPLEGWGRPRGGDNIASVLWLHERIGDPSLLALVDSLHAQTSDWTAELSAAAPPSEAFEFAHGVNRAMGLKEPVLYFRRSGAPADRAAFAAGWRQTMHRHGQIQGTFSSDEMLHGTGSTQGTELCAIVELLASCTAALAVTGEAWIGDAIERMAYNALPAILAADLCTHQYFQLPNQIQCTPGPHRFWVHHDTDLLFGPVTGYGCCAANLHLAWPHLVNHLWLATPDGGLAAAVYAPSIVRTRLGDGRAVTITEATDYPFAGEIELSIDVDPGPPFALALRIPSWAGDFRVTVNGRPLGAEAQAVPAAGGFVRFTRAWRCGDVVRLSLPLRVRATHWERGAVGIERGALVYALAVGEDWRVVAGQPPFCDYEVHPTTAWNYGLIVDPARPEASLRVQSRAVAAQPWASAAVPVTIIGAGKRLPQWTSVDGDSGPIPETGLAPPIPAEPLTLVPFGCARLRISMFPRVSS